MTKERINYVDYAIYATFGLSTEEIKSLLYGDEAFLALSAFDDDHCILSQMVHDLESNTYISVDNTLEDIHHS